MENNLGKNMMDQLFEEQLGCQDQQDQSNDLQSFSKQIKDSPISHLIDSTRDNLFYSQQYLNLEEEQQSSENENILIGARSMPELEKKQNRGLNKVEEKDCQRKMSEINNFHKVYFVILVEQNQFQEGKQIQLKKNDILVQLGKLISKLNYQKRRLSVPDLQTLDYQDQVVRKKRKVDFSVQKQCQSQNLFLSSQKKQQKEQIVQANNNNKQKSVFQNFQQIDFSESDFSQLKDDSEQFSYKNEKNEVQVKERDCQFQFLGKNQLNQLGDGYQSQEKDLCEESNSYQFSQLSKLNIDIQIDTINSSGEQFATGSIEVEESVSLKLINKHFTHSVLDDKSQRELMKYHINFFSYKQKIQEHDFFDSQRYQRNYVTLSVQKPNELNPQIVGRGRNNQVQVLRSLQIKEQQIYAIKKIELPHIPTIETLKNDKIFNQIRAMSKFNHNNIARLFSWWLEKDEKPQKKCYLYMKMEYLSFNATSNSLLDYIYYYMEKKQLPGQERRKQTFEIFNELLAALQYMHTKGYCHRDLKPENILVTQEQNSKLQVKITDFDDSVSIESEKVMQQDCGTQGYVIKHQGDVYEFKDDIFSLGHILFDCLYFDNDKRIKDHQNLNQGKFPPQFENLYPEERWIIEIIVIKRTVRSIHTLINSIPFKKWQNKIQTFTE